MSKKLNKIIMDDFNKTYSMELDKEKIYKNIQVKQEKDDNIQTVLYLKRLCKRISLAACLIIVCLIITIGIVAMDGHEGSSDNIVTKDFEEYMEEYTGVSKYSINSFFQLKENIYINIYNLEDIESGKVYYFYFFENKFNSLDYNLLLNDRIILLKDGSYGILCEFSKDDTNKDICFSIEYNGKVTDYKIG